MTPQTSQRAGVARPLFAFAVAAMAFLLLPSQLQGDVGTVHGFTWQEAATSSIPRHRAMTAARSNASHSGGITAIGWLWHIAWTGLLLALVVLVKRAPIRPVVRDRGADVLAAAGGVIHGVTWVAVTIEGSTTFLGIPAVAVLGLLGWRVLRQSAEARAVGAFLVASAVIALVLYAIYVAMYGWPPPELTETILKS